jgi:hypothetical protein
MLMDNQKLVALGMPGGGGSAFSAGKSARAPCGGSHAVSTEFAKLEKSFPPWYIDRVIGE